MSRSSTAGANGSSYFRSVPRTRSHGRSSSPAGTSRRNGPAALRDGDGFTVVVHPIDEREALGLELGGGDGLHVTSLNDQSDVVNRHPLPGAVVRRRRLDLRSVPTARAGSAKPFAAMAT